MTNEGGELLAAIDRWFERAEPPTDAVHSAAVLLERAAELLRAQGEGQVADERLQRQLGQLDALVRRACDPAASEEERRTSAAIACKRIGRKNLLARLQERLGGTGR